MCVLVMEHPCVIMMMQNPKLIVFSFQLVSVWTQPGQDDSAMKIKMDVKGGVKESSIKLIENIIESY